MEKGAMIARFGKLSEANIGQYEKEAVAVASRTITALEGAIASWEASPATASQRKDDISRCRKALDALSIWEAEALRAAGSGERFSKRAERLSRFIGLCYSF
jgi:hypothetical protein